MEDRKEVIRSSLCELLRSNRSSEQVISAVDDIVLSYVFSYVEELGSDTSDDAFDVEEFTEMMEAYLPGFSDVDSGTVVDWIFKLANKISQTGRSPTSVTTPASPILILNHSNKINNTLSQSSHHQTSKTCPKRLDDKMRGDDGAAGGTHEKSEDIVQLLLEMFPGSCRVEAKRCLQMSGGDTEAAAELMLIRQESGTSLQQSLPKQVHQASSKSQPKDEHLKKTIISKYSFIDEDDDKKEHKPTAPKKDQKKMIRYRDNQIVSTKGERFSDMKKPETEEMKKTYINLKPGKQYRFH